jgi:glucose dehydrogenase
VTDARPRRPGIKDPDDDTQESSTDGLAGALAGSLRARAQTPANSEWRHYAADLANTRYAPLDQIHAGNFNTLKVAWQFRARCA